ncbi:hypothetical protein Ancab_028686 [Ancistrocladus abbreviatus]
MMKEVLAMRNGELQTSRSMCAKTASKLPSLEAQLQILNQQHSSAKVDIPTHAARSLSQNASNPPSITSMSEDGNDDIGNCPESWASALIWSGTLKHEGAAAAMDLPSEKYPDSYGVSNPSNLESLASNIECDALSLVAMLLQSRISRIFESISEETDVEKILTEIKHGMQEIHAKVHPHPVNCDFEEKYCSDSASSQQSFPEDAERPADKEIHNFILSLEQEAMTIHEMADDEDGLSHKIEQLSTSFNKVLSNETSLADFVLSLSHVMDKATKLSFNFLGYKGNEAEASSPDCIDKVALPENRSPQGGRYSNGCSQISDSSCNPEIPQEANTTASFESASCNYSLEEFELLKAEKDNMEREFTTL